MSWDTLKETIVLPEDITTRVDARARRFLAVWNPSRRIQSVEDPSCYMDGFLFTTGFPKDYSLFISYEVGMFSRVSL